MKKYCFIIILSLIGLTVKAQEAIISGRVQSATQHHDELHLEPLVSAGLYWLGTTHGTITDSSGYFLLHRHKGINRLVVSYTGYENDTIEIAPEQNKLTVVLTTDETLDEVVVRKRLGGAYVSYLHPLHRTTITSSGLERLACCNLSESFEQNATVDVGFSDAVSGAKHIKMLGLAGVYSQLQAENIPTIRGLAGTYGLYYVPGTWMESIAISKGAATVVNGYESITGQINLEYKKPEDSDPLFVNLYGNSLGKLETNVLSAIRMNDRLSTMIMAHGSYLQTKNDGNEDGFLDAPMSRQFQLFNRWKYQGEHFRTQFGVSYLQESREGGQSTYYDTEKTSGYGIGIDSKHLRVFWKFGIPFHRPATSIGIVSSVVYHEQESFFGNNIYDGLQNSAYVNAIFNTYIGNISHQISTGLSYQYDGYDETFNDTVLLRKESVPGAFVQYTYKHHDRFTGIIGNRIDHNSHFGWLYTPRLHLKYHPADNWTMRASAGKGYRSANVLAENSPLLASSRSFYFHDEFEIEEAWNYGLNVLRKFHIGHHREATFFVDIYRTDFVNQVVVDMDRHSGEVHFYNLDGRSYANSFQTEFSITPLERLDLTAAFRYNDVHQAINNGLKEKPLVAKYKGLFTASYSTDKDRWQFDFTSQFTGAARLPDTSDKPMIYQRGEHSPAFAMLHAQVTRRFKLLEVYIGAENLTNYRQQEPIVAADAPFSNYFDASIVWGPLLSRRYYGGLRLTIARE